MQEAQPMDILLHVVTSQLRWSSGFSPQRRGNHVDISLQLYILVFIQSFIVSKGYANLLLRTGLPGH